MTIFGRRNNPCLCKTPIRQQPFCGDRGVEDDD